MTAGSYIEEKLDDFFEDHKIIITEEAQEELLEKIGQWMEEYCALSSLVEEQDA